jgi:hypothetical protein
MNTTPYVKQERIAANAIKAPYLNARAVARPLPDLTKEKGNFMN